MACILKLRMPSKQTQMCAAVGATCAAGDQACSIKCAETLGAKYNNTQRDPWNYHVVAVEGNTTAAARFFEHKPNARRPIDRSLRRQRGN
jgi:hypothetical protein